MISVATKNPSLAIGSVISDHAAELMSVDYYVEIRIGQQLRRSVDINCNFIMTGCALTDLLVHSVRKTYFSNSKYLRFLKVCHYFSLMFCDNVTCYFLVPI